MTNEEITERLAEVLRARDPIQPPDDIEDYLPEAAALLPVVRQIADQRAAEVWDEGFDAAHYWWVQTMEGKECGQPLNSYRAATLREVTDR